MRVLVVDRTSENQASLVKLMQSFDAYDQDSLDLSVNLASDRDYTERLLKTDVLFIGPGLQDDAQAISRTARTVAPNLQIIMIVNSETYSSGVFRLAHVSGARKVLPDSASALDILQELVSIHEEFRTSGKVKSGKLIIVTQAKGGVGTTSLCAALGEICGNHQRPTLLWDFDLETMDLSRSLMACGPQAQLVSTWLDEDHELSRQAFRDALVSVSESVSVLTAPDSVTAAYALAGYEGQGVIERIIALARYSHDNIIVDLGGRMGPGSEALLRAADTVVVVADDSILGLSAAHSYVGMLKSLLRSTDLVQFVCSGTKLPIHEIAAQIGHTHKLNERAFRLPIIPFEPGAAHWPGKGKTLFSQGRKPMQDALEGIAIGLELIPNVREELKVVNASGKAKVVSLRSQEASGQRDAVRQFLSRVASF